MVELPEPAVEQFEGEEEGEEDEAMVFSYANYYLAKGVAILAEFSVAGHPRLHCTIMPYVYSVDRMMMILLSSMDTEMCVYNTYSTNSGLSVAERPRLHCTAPQCCTVQLSNLVFSGCCI